MENADVKGSIVDYIITPMIILLIFIITLAITHIAEISSWWAHKSEIEYVSPTPLMGVEIKNEVEQNIYNYKIKLLMQAEEERQKAIKEGKRLEEKRQEEKRKKELEEKKRNLKGYVAPLPEPTPTYDDNYYREYISNRESGGDYNARNGRYYGRWQLDESYLNGDLSPENQDRVVEDYVNSRYGGWQGAYEHAIVYGWY